MWLNWVAEYVIPFLAVRFMPNDPTLRSIYTQCVYLYLSGRSVPAICDFSWAPNEVIEALGCLKARIMRGRIFGFLQWTPLFQCMERVKGWKEYISSLY